MRKRTVTLTGPLQRKTAMAYLCDARDGDVMTLRPPSRSLDQNAAQWPYLEGFSQQLQWPVNGKMVWMEPEEWKDVLTAAFHGEAVRLAMGLDGGVVMLGQRTSKFDKPRFSEWMEFLKATAADRGVTPVYKSEREPVAEPA